MRSSSTTSEHNQILFIPYGGFSWRDQLRARDCPLVKPQVGCNRAFAGPRRPSRRVIYGASRNPAPYIPWGGILPKIIRAVKNEKAGTECQPVSLGAAHAIAQQRPGLLATLSDEAYQKGLERLTDEACDRGEATLIASDFTLVEILAVKGEQPKPKRRRPSFRKAGEVLVVVSVRGCTLLSKHGADDVALKWREPSQQLFAAIRAGSAVSSRRIQG